MTSTLVTTLYVLILLYNCNGIYLFHGPMPIYTRGNSYGVHLLIVTYTFFIIFMKCIIAF